MRLVPIEQKHIDEGLPLECSECPIALALVDVGFEVENLHRSEAIVDERWRAVAVGLACWMYDFDTDSDFRAETKPFTVVLDRKWMGTLSEWQERERKPVTAASGPIATELSSVRYTDRGIEMVLTAPPQLIDAEIRFK